MHPAELQRHRETRTRLHLLKTFHLIGCKSFALSTLSLILLLKLKHHFPSARFPFHAGQGMGAAGLCISVIAPVKSVPEPIIRATHARHAPSRAQISYCLKIECAVTAPSRRRRRRSRCSGAFTPSVRVRLTAFCLSRCAHYGPLPRISPAAPALISRRPCFPTRPRGTPVPGIGTTEEMTAAAATAADGRVVVGCQTGRPTFGRRK